ncbi:DUF6515 family protein [Paraglaciecola sp. 2405UD69-4]|uniref:DUF6515 family protein n=1 Tax=Paraglaciecola sp. 2405UD69-4 TaxID=3391836 RepID=UPI0039C93056
MKFQKVIGFMCCIVVSSCAIGPGGRRGGGSVHGHVQVGNPGAALILGAGVLIGTIITSLPKKHVAVKEDLYLSDGVFYKSTPSGYVAVSAPVGTWVASIPTQHDVIHINNHEYFRNNSNWYQFDYDKNQYQVVKNPFSVSNN